MKQQFKRGDRVKVVKLLFQDGDGDSVIVGQVGTVRIASNKQCLIKFDNRKLLPDEYYFENGELEKIG